MARREFDRDVGRQIDLVVRELKAGLRELQADAARPIESIEVEDPEPGKARTTYSRTVALRRKQALERALDDLEGRVSKEAERLVREAGQLASEEAAGASGVGGAPGVGIQKAAVATAITSAGAEVRNVTDAIRREIGAVVTRAVTGRLTAEEYVAALGEAFDVAQPTHRIERILRTETSGVWMAQQAAVDAELAETGIDLIKRWEAVGGHRGDGRNRDSHRLIHGQERELDEPFNVGGGATDATPPGGAGERAMAPLDAGLSAGERINCRCRYVRVPRSSARQPYIAKSRPRRSES